MKNEEAGISMSGEGAPMYTQQPNPGYNGQMAPQTSSTSEPMHFHGGSSEQQMLRDSYTGSQYSQGQDQSHSNPPHYPIQNVYSQGQQVPSQPYPSPQGKHENPTQNGAQVPQQASHLVPQDGVLEMRSPTEEAK